MVVSDYITNEIKNIVMQSYRDIFASDIFFIRALARLEDAIPEEEFKGFCTKLYKENRM
jgi:hypothetical protein